MYAFVWWDIQEICFSILTMLSFYFLYLHLVSVCCVNSWHTPFEVGCFYLALIFGYWFWSMWWILFFLFKLVLLIILSFLSLLHLNDFCLLTILSPYYNYGVLVVLLIWFILDYVLLSRKEWAVQGSGEGIGNSSIPRPHIGGLYSTPDVQSLWSYDWKKESDVSYVGLKYTCSEEENSLFWKSLEYWTLYLLFFFIRGIYLQ